jgi:hypothetical protein
MEQTTKEGTVSGLQEGNKTPPVKMFRLLGPAPAQGPHLACRK